MSDDRKSFANNGTGVESPPSVGCHPGIPRGEDLEEQNAQFLANLPATPAARCIRRVLPSSDSANGNREAEMPPPLLGSIVERPSPSAGVVRPPNYGGNRGIFVSGGTVASPARPAKGPPSSGIPISTELEEINRENEAYLATLSSEEILAEQERLRQVLPPKLYQKWSTKK